MVIFYKIRKLKGIGYSSLENRFSHAHFGIPPPMIRILPLNPNVLSNPTVGTLNKSSPGINNCFVNNRLLD